MFVSINIQEAKVIATTELTDKNVRGGTANVNRPEVSANYKCALINHCLQSDIVVLIVYDSYHRRTRRFRY